jgi:hypothetical protein
MTSSCSCFIGVIFSVRSFRQSWRRPQFIASRLEVALNRPMTCASQHQRLA